MSMSNNAFNQMNNVANAVPQIPPMLFVMSLDIPEPATWDEFGWSLFTGSLCIAIVAIYMTRYVSRMEAATPLERRIERPVHELPEGIGVGRYAISIFSYAIFCALIMVLAGSIFFLLKGISIDWPAFIGLTLLKNIILAGPVAILGWRVVSKLSAPTSIEARKLPSP